MTWNVQHKSFSKTLMLISLYYMWFFITILLYYIPYDTCSLLIHTSLTVHLYLPLAVFMYVPLDSWYILPVLLTDKYTGEWNQYPVTLTRSYVSAMILGRFNMEPVFRTIVYTFGIAFLKQAFHFILGMGIKENKQPTCAADMSKNIGELCTFW